MKVIYSPKAIEYIKSNNITEIFIRPKLSGGCCGLSSVTLDITTKAGSFNGYIRDYFDGIYTNYDPAINGYLKSSPEIDISVIGFGKYKKLVSPTEFSSLRLD